MARIDILDRVVIDKQDSSTTITNILALCKATFPAGDKIHSINLSDVEQLEVTIRGKSK